GTKELGTKERHDKQDRRPHQNKETNMITVRTQKLFDDRGDVPGWVLITLMTAGLVIIIWGLAGPALSGVFEQAINRVSAF
ncbi:MAG: hypothetical protein JWQ68_1090, partial [Cryobacterium sp.]|nr:hypothetical protein [Cryobacterium sp.]